MKILSRKKQNDILKETLHILMEICGQGMPEEKIEDISHSVFQIIGKTSGRRGLREAAIFLIEQMKLQTEIIKEQNKTAQ